MKSLHRHDRAARLVERMTRADPHRRPSWNGSVNAASLRPRHPADGMEDETT